MESPNLLCKQLVSLTTSNDPRAKLLTALESSYQRLKHPQSSNAILTLSEPSIRLP